MGSREDDHAMALIGTSTCTARVDSGILSFITRLWPRRLGLVDEEKGLVYAFPMFSIAALCMTSRSKACRALTWCI